MLTLCLMRHGKSSWSKATLPDRDRPLNERGRADVPVIGRSMRDAGDVPDQILCSDARRTRETLACLLPYFEGEFGVHVLPDLYSGSADTYLDLIKTLGQGHKRVMVIGHNPATQQTALGLCAAQENSDEMGLHAIERKYPTAGLAVIRFEAHDFGAVASGTGTLARFVSPRDPGPA